MLNAADGRSDARKQMLELFDRQVQQLADQLDNISPNHPEPHATWVRAFLGEKLRLATAARDAAREATARGD